MAMRSEVRLVRHRGPTWITTSTPNHPGAMARMNAPSVVTHRRPENRISNIPIAAGHTDDERDHDVRSDRGIHQQGRSDSGELPDREADQHDARQQPRARQWYHVFDHNADWAV